MSAVSADFSISDGKTFVEDSYADAYGGEIRAQLIKDLNVSRWGGKLTVKSADMAAAYKDIFPASEGSITGTTNFLARFAGDSDRTSMQDGDGTLEIYDGEITGFESAESISKLHGGKPLRFSSAHFTFSLDGKNIYILPGSRVSAPKEDTIFKYVMLDGSVTTEQEVDISCVGNVNIRALNAFVSGIQGVLTTAVEAGAGNSEELLHSFLGNAITGFSKNEFRDISLKVKGHPGEMVFSDLSIAAPVKAETFPDVLNDPENSKEKDTERIELKLTFPVGPGSDTHKDDDVGGQVGGQVLDQILKGLIFD
jgi:hypothetical protein